MATVSDYIECPQCSYGGASYEFNCRDCSEITMCRRCGYHESWEPKYDEGENPCGWKHEISRGAGALWYSSKGRGIFCSNSFNTPKEVLEAERWLREALDQGQVDPEVSYLTKWNREAKQVEFVVGRFYESPEVDSTRSKPAYRYPLFHSKPRKRSPRQQPVVLKSRLS